MVFERVRTAPAHQMIDPAQSETRADVEAHLVHPPRNVYSIRNGYHAFLECVCLFDDVIVDVFVVVMMLSLKLCVLTMNS
jgi:hypothetical protein